MTAAATAAIASLTAEAGRHVAAADRATTPAAEVDCLNRAAACFEDIARIYRVAAQAA